MADLTKEDFLNKIAWEGGIDGALSYGLSAMAYNLPTGMKEGWWELEDLYTNFEDAAVDWVTQWDPEELSSD